MIQPKEGFRLINRIIIIFKEFYITIGYCDVSDLSDFYRISQIGIHIKFIFPDSLMPTNQTK